MGVFYYQNICITFLANLRLSGTDCLLVVDIVGVFLLTSWIYHLAELLGFCQEFNKNSGIDDDDEFIRLEKILSCIC